jgi:hypothetical protein
MVCGQIPIRAKSWIGSYRQLRVRCGPFIEVIVPKSHRQSLNSSENAEIIPRFKITLLYCTVKYFLHDARASGPLFFEKEADLLVRGSLKRYVQLVLPVQESNYCPIYRGFLVSIAERSSVFPYYQEAHRVVNHKNAAKIRKYGTGRDPSDVASTGLKARLRYTCL